MKLGLLNLSSDIAHHVEQAPLADQLGFSRYWVAEHQPQPSPTLFAAVIAGLTERIRVGTAGILLHYYPPRRIAHDFHFLERAYPGRIDAGFCGGMAIVPALADDAADGRDMSLVFAGYDQRAGRLIRALRNRPGAPDHDDQTSWAGSGDTTPQIWSLGGGQRSAALALEHGIALGYALLFANSHDSPDVAHRYRREFAPIAEQTEPLLAVAIAGFCAETDAEAQRRVAGYQGTFFAPRVVGSARACAGQLEAVRERYGADEVVFAELSHELEHQLASTQLLAGALG